MDHEVVTWTNQLPTAESKSSHLVKILGSLAKMTPNEVKCIIDRIPISHIVECMENEGDIALSILERLFIAVEPHALLQKFETLFIHGLVSGNETILRACLQQLNRVVSESPQSFDHYSNIVIMLIELLFVEETGCMSLIEAVILGVGKRNVEIFTCAEVFKILDLLPADKQLRFFDVVVKLAVSEQTSMTYFLNSGVFSRLFKIYAHAVSNDPLMLINCLEIFANVFVSPLSLDVFNSNGLIASFSRDMIAAKTSSFASIIIPHFLKLFTTIGRTNFPLLIAEHSHYFELLNDCCQHPNDIGSCLVGLESFAILSQIPESKDVFISNQFPSLKVDEWLSQLRTLLFRGGSDDIQAKALLITADLFTVPKHVVPTKAYFDTNARWFNVLFDSRLGPIMEWAKSPLAERHVAAQRLFLAMATQPWAQQLMAATQGFTDFLVDRNTEHDKMGRELKYEIVKAIFSSSTAAGFFDGPEIIKLGVYVRQGPFFSTATATVAMDAE